MQLEEIIKLFQRLEKGESPAIGYHLHKPISQALKQDWRTNQDYSASFSGFLTALQETEYPPE